MQIKIWDIERKIPLEWFKIEKNYRKNWQVRVMRILEEKTNSKIDQPVPGNRSCLIEVVEKISRRNSWELKKEKVKEL